MKKEISFNDLLKLYENEKNALSETRAKILEITSILDEIKRTKNVLTQMKKGKVLFDLGSGVFVYGEVKEEDEVVYTLETGVSIRGKREDVVKYLSKKEEELSKHLNALKGLENKQLSNLRELEKAIGTIIGKANAKSP